MLLLLIAGIGCLAVCGFELTRSRTAAERQRAQALKSVQTNAGSV